MARSYRGDWVVSGFRTTAIERQTGLRYKHDDRINVKDKMRWTCVSYLVAGFLAWDLGNIYRDLPVGRKEMCVVLELSKFKVLMSVHMGDFQGDWDTHWGSVIYWLKLWARWEPLMKGKVMHVPGLSAGPQPWMITSASFRHKLTPGHLVDTDFLHEKIRVCFT